MLIVSRFKKVDGFNTLKAFADIVLYGKIAICGIRIIEAEGKLIVKLPDRKTNKGEWEQIVKVLDMEEYNEISNKLISLYNA